MEVWARALVREIEIINFLLHFEVDEMLSFLDLLIVRFDTASSHFQQY